MKIENSKEGRCISLFKVKQSHFASVFAQSLGHLLDDLLLFNEENIHDLLTHSLVAQDTAMSPGEQSLKWFR